MQEFPPLPTVDDAPEVLDGGHLWLVERVDGLPLRFTVEPGGWLAFAGPEGRFDDDPPPEYRHAVRGVRASIDHDALVEVPEGTVLYGVATTHRRIEYDWDRLPAFLGAEVWAGGGYLPPDAAERAFERLGLDPVNALEKEVAARHFSLSAYDVPDSAWYDGPPLGVVVRNKGGGRALLRVADPDPPDPEGEPAEVAAAATTPARIEAAVESLDEGAGFGAVRERVIERVVRERYGAITAPEGTVDMDAVVGAIGDAAREYLLAERPELVG